MTSESNLLSVMAAFGEKRKRSDSSGTFEDNGSNSCSTFDEHSTDIKCPICFEIIEDAQVTECGHTFCSECILKSMETKNRCPTCGHEIDKVFPNFMLNQIIAKSRKSILIQKESATEWTQMITSKVESLNPNDVDALLTTLKERKQEIEKTSKAVQSELLKGFLFLTRKLKEEQVSGLVREIKIIDDDAELVERMINPKPLSRSSPKTMLSIASSSHHHFSEANRRYYEEFNLKPPDEKYELGPINSSLTRRWRKMKTHFDDLHHVYLSSRKNILGSSGSNDEYHEDLVEFRETLNKVTSCTSLKTLATLGYTSDPIKAPSIVSSIAFDKDKEIFAIGGVTKKIKLFDYEAIIRDSLILKYPITTIESKSKISCVAFSPYFKSTMGSSDYEGSVLIWDIFTKQKIHNYQEHERRCWSVDFNKIDTHLLTSGSDDGTVKLWSLNMNASASTIKTNANVCFVKFNPKSRYHLAFGSADHCVYYYDLRNLKVPEAIFRDHRRAVSHISYMNGNEFASIATDSTVKLWSTRQEQCVRAFRGHLNEKNFVGLATNSDYIATGSETNSIFFYYKGFLRPIANYSFDCDADIDPLQFQEQLTSEDPGFISAICWREDENILVGANSRGVIKIIELT